MSKRISLSDWGATVDELRKFGKTGSVTDDEDRIHIDFRSAHVEVSRDGHISAGMPLHDFEQDGDVDFVVDHDAGLLTIEGDDVSYTFKRPGG